MHYYVYVVNFNTLCRAIRYIDSVWGIENATLLYADQSVPMPERIGEMYQAVSIEEHLWDRDNRLKRNLGLIRLAKKSWTILDHMLQETAGEAVLVVFRDNELQEATMIDCAMRKYASRLHLWLFEEGTGIYAKYRLSVKGKIVKRLIYGLFRVSQYALTDKPQGMHTKVEKIICQYPNILKEKITDPSVIIEQMIEIYSDDFNEKFVEMCLGDINARTKYDFVFLTVPILDYSADRYNGTPEKYQNDVRKIVEMVSHYGKVVIKPHPRDYLDYSQFESDRVGVCRNEENVIPYECLATWYGYPQMISAFSSASINERNGKRSYYISDILGISDGGFLFSDDYYIANHIIQCKSMEHLEREISQDVEEGINRR